MAFFKFIRMCALGILLLAICVTARTERPDFPTDTLEILSYLDSAKSLLYTNNLESYAFASRAIALSEENHYPIGSFKGHSIKGGRWWSEMQWDSSLFHYYKAASIARANGLQESLIGATGNIGFVYTYMNMPDSALVYLQKSTDYARAGNYTTLLIEALMKLGLHHEQSSDYPSAARSYGEALNLAQELSAPELQGRAYSALGKLYTIIGDHEAALKQLKNGARFLKDVNPTSLFSTYSNICEIYSNKIVNRDSALVYSRLAREVVPDSRKQILDYVNAVNLGTLYFNLDQRDSAFAKFRIAYTNPLNSRLSKEKAITSANIGVYYLSKGQTDSASVFLNKALEVAEELNLQEIKILALEQLFKLDQQARRSSKALEKQIAINESIKALQKTESRNILARNQIERERLATKYKYDLLKIENEAQKQHIRVQTTRVYLIGGFLIITFILTGILALQYRSKTHAYRKLVEKNKEITLQYSKRLSESSERSEHPDEETEENPTNYQQILTDLENLMTSAKLFLEPNITVVQLSSALNINRRTLSTILSSKYQMNFNEYINHYRILEAQRLLMSPKYNNFTIAAVGEMCGFKTERTFFNAFKNSTGVTPLIFRNTKFTSKMSLPE